MMMTPHDKELLVELLIQWEELYEKGEDKPARDLCRDHPHLTEKLARRIAVMKATDWLNDPHPPASDPPAIASQPFQDALLAGRYRLDELVAEGGFAQVWRAHDNELQRIVAIKVPKPGRLESSESFMAEARRVARLKHPGIVPVHDVGRDGDRCFIVSEFIEGGSLANQVARENPSRDQVIRWICEVADALEYAHVHGVIHRDIKPANILVDHHGRALLADFGIAQSAQKTGVFAPSLGTLRYMSPEQLEGKQATPKSDIYSLGVVLHECLTGKLPYGATDPTGLRREIIAGRPPVHDRRIPPEVASVCNRALSRSPDKRHNSAAHFAAALRRATSANLSRIGWAALFWLFALTTVGVGGLVVWRARMSMEGANESVVSVPLPAAKPMGNVSPSPAELLDVDHAATVEVLEGAGVRLPLENGNKLFNNRGYVWKWLPQELPAMEYHLLTGGGWDPVKFRVTKSGWVYVVIPLADFHDIAQADGWEKIPITFEYTDVHKTKTTFFRRQHEPGEYTMPRRGFAGPFIVTPAASTQDKSPTAPTSGGSGTAEDRVRLKLQDNMTLNVHQDSFERVLARFAMQLGVPLEIDAPEFKLAGISRNTSFTVAEQDKPAVEILDGLLKKADPDGRLTYLIRVVDGQPEILVTTRAAAGTSDGKAGEDDIREKLLTRISLGIPKTSLEKALWIIAEKAGVPIEFDNPVLQRQGLTRNQLVSLTEREATIEEFIDQLLLQATPDGRLTYAIRVVDGQRRIIITVQQPPDRG